MAQNPARNTAEKLMLQFLVLPERPSNSNEGFLFIFPWHSYTMQFHILSTKKEEKKHINKKKRKNVDRIQNKILKHVKKKKSVSFFSFIQKKRERERLVHIHSTIM